MNRTYHAVDCDSPHCTSDQTLHDAIIAADNAAADNPPTTPRAYVSSDGAGVHPIARDASRELHADTANIWPEFGADFVKR